MTRLAWGLRRWWWISAAAVPIVVWVVVGGLQDDRGERRYETSALVVAQQLAIRPEQLPRFAEAVFSSGAVAEGVSEAVTGGVEPDELVPRYVDVEPVLDTIAVRVIGRAGDPDSAAVLADQAALVFVRELNEAGPGVGFFAIQDEARVPEAPVSDGSPPFALALGILSAAAFTIGLVGLALGVRWPVIDASEAAAVAGAPALGTLVLPRVGRRSGIEARSVVGLDVLGRRLLPGPKRVALVGAGPDDGVPAAVAALLAAVVRPRFVARLVDPLASATPTAEASAAGSEALVVHVPGDAVDVPQLLGDRFDVAVVVVEGCRRSALERVVSQFLPGHLAGVVFVRARSRRSLRSVAAVPAAPPPATHHAAHAGMPAVAPGGLESSNR